MNYSMQFGVIGVLSRATGAVMHHKRDVSLSEDDLRTGKAEVSRLLGSLRPLVISLLEGMNVKNIAAQLDTFADKFTTLIQFLTQQMVL